MGCPYRTDGRRYGMPEGIFYSEEVHERVALYITDHGGKIQTERVNPGWVFHKVTISYTGCKRIGGGDYSPIYQYDLSGGARLLIQCLRGKGSVPGHPDDYWSAMYIYTEDGEDGKREQRAEIR
jgi:hypothetical protein